MAFQTYQQGLKIATETANRAISTESSLSSLSPLTSPLPTLQRTFHLYIQSAEQYSHLLSSNLVPSHERDGLRKKWGLVLSRAEKVKKRIESLGGSVGKVEGDDAAEEGSILRRGGGMNGLKLDLWSVPGHREFESAGGTSKWREEEEPDMPDVDVVWSDIGAEKWDCVVDRETKERWVVRQGTGADCSVAAGLGVSLEHNRLWGTRLGSSALYPQAETTPMPIRSENGKHVVKLLLNGAWRSVIIDALLPRSATTSQPLHATTHPIPPFPSASSPKDIHHPNSHSRPRGREIGPPWIPLITKAYFKALGGYTIRGSDPGPDIYAFTGWIPDRLSLREGFQREKEWKRISQAWREGKVLITLGTGGRVQRRELIAFHAYGVIGLHEDQNGERMVEIVDPGSTPRQSDGVLEEAMGNLGLEGGDGICTMTWDQVCSDYEVMSLNWDPALYPRTAIRHWSWPKVAEGEQGLESSPRYRLKVRGSGSPLEICIMLSQHTVNKDRPLDDIALHVFEEHQSTGRRSRVLHPQRAETTSPYSNGLHVLVRYTPRHPSSDLIIIPSRDQGLFARDFTLQAFAPSSNTLQLERLKSTLPFSQLVHGHLNSRNGGGHPGNPSHMINPQYRVVVKPSITHTKSGGVLRMMIHGDRELPWNIKLVWGSDRVIELTEDAVIADSGAYSFGMGYCDVEGLEPGTYTAIISTFEPGVTAPFTLKFESDRSIAVDALPPEGAGMYSRILHGEWSTGKGNAGGRPSGGSYSSNPVVEVILPKPGSVTARLHLPEPLGYPINLTAYKRSTDGTLGDQVATTGPYSDTLSGVCIAKTKLDAGIYLFVPSTYDKGLQGAWTMNVWSDVSLSAERAK